MTQKADESYIKNKQCLSDALSIREDMYEGNIPIDHVSIGHHQPQRSVPSAEAFHCSSTVNG